MRWGNSRIGGDKAHVVHFRRKRALSRRFFSRRVVFPLSYIPDLQHRLGAVNVRIETSNRRRPFLSIYGVKLTTAEVKASRLRALAEPNRLRIVDLLLSRGELKSREIADSIDCSWPTASQHLRALVEAGFLTERRAAQNRFYNLAPQGFDDLEAYLARFWKHRLVKFKDFVELNSKE